MLTKRCTYGLRTILFLAAQEPEEYVSVRTISERLAMPYSFLAKVVQALTRCGLLRSQRGPHGGVALARPADELVLKDVIEAIDGPALFETCVLGLPGCGTQKPCPLHEQWKEVLGGIHTVLAVTSIDDLAQRMAAWRSERTDSHPDQEAALFLAKTKTKKS